MTEPDFRKTYFSGRKCRKYTGNHRFYRFSLDFFLIFRSFFSNKNISDIAFSFVRSFLPSFLPLFVCSFARSFVLSLSGRSNQHLACSTFFLFPFYIYHQLGPICNVLVNFFTILIQTCTFFFETPRSKSIKTKGNLRLTILFRQFIGTKILYRKLM